jgi:alpha-tubulin suppressor-like RCC1 family protein
MLAPRKLRQILISSGLALSAFACEKGPSEPSITLTVSPSNPVVVVGASLQLEAAVPDGLSLDQGSDTTWSSSVPSVISVDSTGIVTAKASGSATITVGIGSASGQLIVTAENPSIGIQAKDRVTCGIVANGDAYCWGANGLGQVGIGTMSNAVADPSKVVGVSSFTTINPGGAHTCGTTASGATYCWGCNSEGELGIGSSAYTEGKSGTCGTVQTSPVRVSTSETFSDVEAASSILQSAQGSICSDAACLARTCALGTGGQLYCWGQLRTTPVAVTNAPKFKSLSIHLNRGCGVATDQTMYCFPISWTGGPELIQPSALVPETRMQSVSVGRFHACSLDMKGRAWCFGANIRGELGSPSTETCSRRIYGPYACRAVPDTVYGGLRFQSISAGGGTLSSSDSAPISHTCGVTVQQEIFCWGDNQYGQLGNGTQASAAVPAKVSSDLKFRSVTAGYLYTCAVTVSGAGYCWGGMPTSQYFPPTAIVSTPTLVSASLVFK